MIRLVIIPVLILVVSTLVTILPTIARGQPEPTGEELFSSKGCVGCHSIGGQGGEVGPSLDTVGDRYTAEWLYTWLRDPSAVKPGTAMPNLHLTDNERALLVFYLMRLRSTQMPVVAAPQPGTVQTNPPDLNPESPENEYLKLGTEESYVREQRFTLQDQIQSFIPPLYEPAFTQSAFVLPPGAFRIGFAFRDLATIDAEDVSDERNIGARFVDFDLERKFLDLDLFLGLDHNLTVRVNVPFISSRVNAELNPGFFDPVTVFPKSSTAEFGDISLLVKKKFADQGNYPFGIAAVAGIRTPTGPNDERFNTRTTVNIGGDDSLLPLPAVDVDGMIIPGSANGTFRRFSNDGRLPAPLQPGLGTVGASFGLFGTRIFEGSTLVGRGAFHSGGFYEIRPEEDGIDPGNLFTYFATGVKPLFGDKVSFDLTYLLRYQGEDSYDGKFAVPSPEGLVILERPSFSGGTTQFLATSLIVIPNPLARLLLSGLWRIDKPGLGPSPSYIIRMGLQYTFASGLFRSGQLK